MLGAMKELIETPVDWLIVVLTNDVREDEVMQKWQQGN